MRPLPFVATLAVFAYGAQAQSPERAALREEVTAESEPAELQGQPITLVPVLSAPLPAIATGVPIRLEPYKPAAAPRRPPPPSQPAAQARPR